MGTLTQGVVRVSDRSLDGPVGEPIPVLQAGLAQAGDVWTDRDGDQWLAGQSGTLGLCRSDGTVPDRARRMTLRGLSAEYGPLVLQHRRGRTVSGGLQLRVERPL